MSTVSPNNSITYTLHDWICTMCIKQKMEYNKVVSCIISTYVLIYHQPLVFLRNHPRNFLVPSQIFCVSNPIPISLGGLGTLAECWKPASFLLTGFMVISSVSSTQQPSIFSGSSWEMVFMGSKGFYLMALTIINTV